MCEDDLSDTVTLQCVRTASQCDSLSTLHGMAFVPSNLHGVALVPSNLHGVQQQNLTGLAVLGTSRHFHQLIEVVCWLSMGRGVALPREQPDVLRK